MDSRPRISASLGVMVSAPTTVITVADDGKALEVVSVDEVDDAVTRGLKHAVEIERNRPSYGAPRVLLADSPQSHAAVIAERLADRSAGAIVHVEQPRREISKPMGMLAAMAAMSHGAPFQHQLPRGARQAVAMPRFMEGIAGRSTIGDNPAGTTDPEVRAARTERRAKTKRLRARRGRR